MVRINKNFKLSVLRKKILVGTYFLAQAKKENKILELNKTILATLKKEEDRELFKTKAKVTR